MENKIEKDKELIQKLQSEIVELRIEHDKTSKNFRYDLKIVSDMNQTLTQNNEVQEKEKKILFKEKQK